MGINQYRRMYSALANELIGIHNILYHAGLTNKNPTSYSETICLEYTGDQDNIDDYYCYYRIQHGEYKVFSLNWNSAIVFERIPVLYRKQTYIKSILYSFIPPHGVIVINGQVKISCSNPYLMRQLKNMQWRSPPYGLTQFSHLALLGTIFSYSRFTFDCEMILKPLMRAIELAQLMDEIYI